MATYILYQLIRGFVLFILWYVVIMNGIYVLQMISAVFVTRVHISKTRNFEYRLMGSSGNMIPISLLTPAHNEEATIIESVRSMLNVNYTNYEIIVINDGSTDNTLNKIISTFNLHKITYPVRERLAAKKVRAVYYNPDIPRLRVIDKENGGKSDALNAGINLSRYPYIVSLDADSLLEADALLRIAMVFMQNKYTIAVGGTLRVVNGCDIENGNVLRAGVPKKIWPLFQYIEYIRSFLVGRTGWDKFNSLLIISGAFGAFQKEAVLQVGGYSTGTMGEDMDLVMKLHRYMRSKKYKYRVSFMPDPICWTQVPESIDILRSQRRRWQIGLIDVMGRCRGMFLNPRFGIIGLLAMPYYLLFEVVSPFVELFGYFLIPVAWYFGLLSSDAVLLFFMAVFIFGMITSIGSLVVESFISTKHIKLSEALLLSVLSIPENFFFRQMTVFFRLLGILGYRKQKNNWGLMKHQKFTRDKSSF